MDRLDAEFERTDSFKRVDPKSKMFDIKLGNDKKSDYFAKYEAIVAQFDGVGGEVTGIDRIAALIK